jgi:hypothetical protein
MMRFTCKHCMKEKVYKFRFEYDTDILDHPEALLFRSLTITESNDDPLDSVPTKLKKWIHIIPNEAPQGLPRQSP